MTHNPNSVEKSAANAYSMLQKSGLLCEFYPNLTGNWDEDKEDFLEIYIEEYNKHKQRK